MGDRPQAELIADRGASAQSADLFRSRSYLDAEGVTHTLLVEDRGWRVAMPVITRAVEGDGAPLDAVSPYGYPGALVHTGDGDPPDPAKVDWAATGLVSLFVRERIGTEPCLAEARERSMVQVHDPARPRQIRPRLAEQIRHNERLGYEVTVSHGLEASSEDRAAFHAAYTETMERAQAADRYLFSAEYLDAVLAFDGSWLLTARSPVGAVAAGAIAAVSDGLVHYFLGGTGSAHLDASPFKNVVGRMLDLAGELGMPLNLGGGVVPGDGLESFKRGFANCELPFFTHEVICDPSAYAALSAGVEETGYFPAYRAPAARG